LLLTLIFTVISFSSERFSKPDLSALDRHS
jgi:hypothetical protein